MLTDNVAVIHIRRNAAMENTFYQELGKRIRAFRKSRGMTIRELAVALNKSVPTVSKYESGSVAIGVDMLIDICRCFNIDVSLLLPSTSTHPEDPDTGRYEKYYEDILYIYWYNGEHKRLRSAIIDNRNSDRVSSLLYYDIDDPNHLDRASFIYTGNMNYSDTGTVFLYTNSLPPFDKMVMRVPSFTRNRPYRIGLMTSLTLYYQNVATKILASSTPIQMREMLIEELKISADDIKNIRRTNFFIV